jgi:hypothetical protein
MKFLAKRAGAEVGSSCREHVVLRVGLFKDRVADRKGIRTTVSVNTGTDDVGDRACVDQEQKSGCVGQVKSWNVRRIYHRDRFEKFPTQPGGPALVVCSGEARTLSRLRARPRPACKRGKRANRPRKRAQLFA